MKHTAYTILALALLAGGCNPYDDSSLWKQIDESQKSLSSVRSSLESLSGEVAMLKALASGGAVTSVTACPTGGYTVTFTTASGESGSVVVAASTDVVDADIIGMKEEGGVQYWTITVKGKTSFLTDADGARIPVSGRTPSFSVDKSGYWTVNGQYVLDAQGSKVKSSGSTASLITGVKVEDDGTVTFSFGDGSQFSADSSESLYIVARIDGVRISDSWQLGEDASSLTVTYEVSGRQAEGAIVSVSRCNGVDAVLDESSRSIAVTVLSPDSFNGGGFIITATSVTTGAMAVRPVYFSGNTDVEMENDLWSTTDTVHLAPGCTWYRMEFKGIKRKMNVLEVRLSSDVEITSAYADDCVPNPNGNSNVNNGFCIRETLSQLCARKRTEGENVLAGVNSGFFDSNDGISRGAHISGGQFVYMPNPKIADGLTNHAWAFTVFKDGTASCAKKTFSGKVKIAGREERFYSVNDTILRGGSSSVMKKYPVNVYTSAYREIPHASYPKLRNNLSEEALYIVAALSGGGLCVNEGWIDGTVTRVVAGSEERPYLTTSGEIAVQIHESDTAGLSSVKVGDTISISAEMKVGDVTKPILTQNSTMWQFITDGVNTAGTVPLDHTFRTDLDPMTFVTVNKKATSVCIIEIDGRQDNWSLGVTVDDCADIALHLGAWNATRFDGGGSSAMWLYRSGAGSLISKPCDSKGERSCLNYIYLRRK